MPDRHTEIERLQADNAELRRRLDLVDHELVELRHEALARRSEVRGLAEALPAAMSRRVLMTRMARDVRHHPDKLGVTKRAIRKLGRAPRRAARDARDRLT